MNDRFIVLDGLRGLFLVLMTVGHLRLTSVFLELHPSRISFIDAASGFVLLSGLVTGLVCGQATIRSGASAVRERLHRRAGTLYLWALTLLAGLILVAQLAPPAALAWTDMLGPLAHPQPASMLAGALLLQHVDYVDILTQYIFYLFLAPVVIAQCLKGRSAAVLATSLLVWFSVQMGATGPLLAVLERGLGVLGSDLSPPRMFNLLAWQVLFVGGCILGVETHRRGAASWATRAGLGNPVLLFAVLGFLAAVAAVRVADGVEPLRPLIAPLEPALPALARKGSLGLLCLLNVLAAGWLTAWLCLVAPNSTRAPSRVCGLIAMSILKTAWLRLLGRHSLAVFLWHVVLIYAVEALIPTPGELQEPVSSAYVLLVLGLLSVPALLTEAWRRVRENNVPPLQPRLR